MQLTATATCVCVYTACCNALQAVTDPAAAGTVQSGGGWVVLRKHVLQHLFALSTRCGDAVRYAVLYSKALICIVCFEHASDVLNLCTAAAATVVRAV
jgi:hypothetical protein